jgi:Family of unknown function (DUF6174)
MNVWFRHPSLVAIGLTLASCGVLDPDRRIDGLDAARARWALLEISDYEIVIERVCFCPEVDPVRVRVVDNQVVGRTYLTSGAPVPADRGQFYPDVAGLFDLLEDANRRGASINASFDQQYGFPTSAAIDYIKNAIDDEVSIRVADFDLLATPEN